MRNSLRERKLKLDNIGASFSMQTLRNLLALNGPVGDRFRAVLNTSMLDPPDVMAMTPVECLWNGQLLAELNSYIDDSSLINPNDPGKDEVLGLYHFLCNMKTYYFAFNTPRGNLLSPQTRLDNLSTCTHYLVSPSFGMSVTKNLESAVQRTLNGMKLLFEGAPKLPTPPDPPSSWIAHYLQLRHSSWRRVCTFMKNGTFLLSTFSTLPVEHFFSTIRSLCNLPTADDYGWAYVHACATLFDMLCRQETQSYPRLPVPKSTTYPQRSGILFSRPRDHYNKEKRKEEIQAVFAANEGTNEQLDWCKTLATQFRRSRYTSSIRQGKKQPFDTLMQQKQNYSYQCGPCIQKTGLSRAWKTSKTLINHWMTIHATLVDTSKSLYQCFVDIDKNSTKSPYVSVYPPTKEGQNPPIKATSPALVASPPAMRTPAISFGRCQVIVYDIEHVGGRDQDMTNLSAWNITADPSGEYRFNSIVRPNHPPTSRIVELNHLSMDVLNQYPSWQTDSARFMEWLNSFNQGDHDFHMISHHGSSDAPVLLRHLTFMNLSKEKMPKMKFYDSVKLFSTLKQQAYAKFPNWPLTAKRGGPCYKLDDISKYLLDFTDDGHQTHLAYDDVTLLVQSLSKALLKVKGEGFDSVEALEKTCVDYQSCSTWPAIQVKNKKKLLAEPQPMIVDAVET